MNGHQNRRASHIVNLRAKREIDQRAIRRFCRGAGWRISLVRLGYLSIPKQIII
jgi:hypothetical protein